jgi:hypothetical protein
MHSLREALQNNLTGWALALMLAVLWLLMNAYQGFAGDAQIYAFQALARIHPALSADLYLQNTSQDQFTLFSPIYACFVQWLGLENAARLLTLAFTVWIVWAAWNLSAAITDNSTAWLAAGFFLIATGDYGASGVFRIYEPYLTARLPAQALAITALGCYFRGMRHLGVLLCIAALLIHPLMAFPGLLLLICLRFSTRSSLIGAAAAVLAASGIALSVRMMPAAAQAFGIMDAQWLEVVQERSQFLFLKLWNIRDWDLNVRPLISLAFMALVFDDARIRRLCHAAVLVGAGGLIIALVGGLVGPVPLLVQGQAWRWDWIPCLLSILLLPAGLFRIWRDPTCGPLCTVLLLCGWLVSAIGGTICVVLCAIFWLVRKSIADNAIPIFRWMAVAAAVGALAWLIGASSSHKAMTISTIGALPAVKVLAVLLFGFLWRWLQGARAIGPPAFICALLLVASIFIAPAVFKHARVLESPSDLAEFAEWRSAIPAESTVLIAPPRDVGSFVWFTLGRPNYLALDQSAGVVFSRDTALEVRRRSEVLMPLMDPTWKILSGIRARADKRNTPSPTRPLTAERLSEVCADPRLGFVISPQDVAFNRLRHQNAGIWKDWNLYDCAQVRSARPKT